MSHIILLIIYLDIIIEKCLFISQYIDRRVSVNFIRFFNFILQMVRYFAIQRLFLETNTTCLCLIIQDILTRWCQLLSNLHLTWHSHNLGIFVRFPKNIVTKRLLKNISTLSLKHHCFEEEFEDTQAVIRIRKSKKNRQHNGQKKIKLNKMKLNCPPLQYKQFVVVWTTETILFIVYLRYMLSCFRKLGHFT
jgi:hypothetical protein